MKKNLLLGIVGFLVVLGVGYVVYDKTEEGVPQKTPTASPQASGNQGVPTGVSTVRPECQLGGQIVFIADKTYRSEGATFDYKNVEDSHDFIRWTITPEEDASIGPNMFNGLPLPAGKETIIIGFNQGPPKRTTYELSASIDYPYLVNNEVVILNKKCSGVTKVKTDY